MRSAIRLLAPVALPLAVTLASGRAVAIEAEVAGKPLLIDVTNTAVVDYHFNNRNDFDLNVPNQLDDFYGEFLDRLNIQASYWRFRLGLRLDGAVFFHRPTRDTVASLVGDQKPIEQASGKDPNEYTNQFYRELHSRYLRAFYPAKLFLGYAQPGVDVTVGDFYVQLGRGIVFSVRKIDELAVDTTVRGVKAVADRKIGEVQLGLTAFGGQMNPLRVEETSGRRLHGDGSPLFFGFPTSGDLETYSNKDRITTLVDPAAPSYLEDAAVGGGLSAATKWFTLGANAAGVLRRTHAADYLRCLSTPGMNQVTSGATIYENRCASLYPDFTTTDPSKEHNRIVNWSGTVTVPSIAKHGDVYLEVAGQNMSDGHLTQATAGHPTSAPGLSGYAVYGSASITGGPVSISIEGKHYRNYFPLSAHIDTTTPGFGAPEYSLVTYSQPPTAEPVYTEIVGGGSPNVCISGGRARADYRFNREASVYAWLGRYVSWSEIPYDLSQGCQITPDRQTNTWDSAAGVDLGFEKGKTHLKVWVGGRSTDHQVTPINADGSHDSSSFYREGYVRYDIVKHLGGRFSLQLQGFHRHRYEPDTAQEAWNEGENYTALQWSPHLSAIFGYEYLAKEHCQPPRSATLTLPARDDKSVCHYVNGGLQWRASNAGADRPATKYVAQVFDAVSVFVGQRRGALRCVSGVCRQFPPFEGARVEITSRF